MVSENRSCNGYKGRFGKKQLLLYTKKCILVRRPLLSKGIEIKTEEIVTDEVTRILREEFSVELTL